MSGPVVPRSAGVATPVDGPARRGTTPHLPVGVIAWSVLARFAAIRGAQRRRNG